MKSIVGNIYYKNNYDGLDVFRVFGEFNGTLYCRREYDTIQESVKVNTDYFNRGFKLIPPCGKMLFMILDLPDKSKDVAIVFLKKNGNDFRTEAVCRQNIVDMYSSMYARDYYDYRLGMSLCRENSISEDMYRAMFNVDGISTCYSVSTYMDDKLGFIVNMVPQIEFSFMLRKIKTAIEYQRKARHLPPPKGLCSSLLNLIVNTGFDDDYYRALQIIPLPISLRKSYEKRTLGVLEQRILEDIIGKHVVNNQLVRYSKDVNFDMISKDYLLLADRHRDLYILVFDDIYPVLPEYANNHLDILRRFHMV